MEKVLREGPFENATANHEKGVGARPAGSPGKGPEAAEFALHLGYPERKDKRGGVEEGVEAWYPRALKLFQPAN